METRMCRTLYTGSVAKSLIFGFFQVAFGSWDTVFQDLLSFLLLFLMGARVVGTRFSFSWFSVFGFWINQETILKVTIICSSSKFISLVQVYRLAHCSVFMTHVSSLSLFHCSLKIICVCTCTFAHTHTHIAHCRWRSVLKNPRPAS